MHYCVSCKEPFLPGDEIDLGALELPRGLFALLPLARPYLSRLLLFRCAAPGCGGIVTAAFLPAPPLHTPQKEVDRGQQEA